MEKNMKIKPIFILSFFILNGLCFGMDVTIGDVVDKEVDYSAVLQLLPKGKQQSLDRIIKFIRLHKHNIKRPNTLTVNTKINDPRVDGPNHYYVGVDLLEGLYVNSIIFNNWSVRSPNKKLVDVLVNLEVGHDSYGKTLDFKELQPYATPKPIATPSQSNNIPSTNNPQGSSGAGGLSENNQTANSINFSMFTEFFSFITTSFVRHKYISYGVGTLLSIGACGGIYACYKKYKSRNVESAEQQIESVEQQIENIESKKEE